MASLRYFNGSMLATGIFPLKSFTLFMKNLFMLEASPAGLVTILPSQNSCVGGPVVLHPSQPFTAFQISELASLSWLNLSFSQFLLSSLTFAVVLFLRDLNNFQSSGSFDRAAFLVHYSSLLVTA